MKKNNILAILIAIIMVAFFAITAMQQKTIQAVETELFMPNLRKSFNEITSINLMQGENFVTINKNEAGKWVVKQKYNYPANMQELRKMLLYLSQSELRAKKTDDPTRFSKIGLDEYFGKKLQIFIGEKLLYDVVIGAVAKDFSTTYVRRAGENQTYAASGELKFSLQPENWLNYAFISVEPERVQTIDFGFNGKKPYQYVRQTPKQTMQLTPAADGKLIIEKDTNKNPASYFEKIAFTDVLPISQKTSEIQNVTTLKTFDGLVINMEFHEVEFMPWVAVSARVDEQIRKQYAELQLKPLMEIKAEAEQINSLTNGWLYQLGHFQQQNLRRSYLDITEIKLD